MVSFGGWIGKNVLDKIVKRYEILFSICDFLELRECVSFISVLFVLYSCFGKVVFVVSCLLASNVYMAYFFN